MLKSIEIIKLKREVVFISRLLYEKGLIAGTDGNVSVRYGDVVITTPSGICKGFLRSRDLVTVDLDGNKLSGRLGATSELKMHLAVYGIRSDVRAIVHAHPPYCLSLDFASIDFSEGIIPELAVSLGSIPTVSYLAPSTRSFASSIGAVIKKTDAVILERHGSLTVGVGLRSAYFKLEQMEHGAKIILHSHLLGGIKKLSKSQLKELMALRVSVYNLSNPIIPFDTD